MFSNQAYIFTIIYWAVSDCSYKDWIASECFLDIKHLNTAKVYCTITEATRKPAYFKHQPIRDHFIKGFFVCRCALEHVWAYIASINVSLNRIHITLTSFCVSLLLRSASGVEIIHHITCPIGMREGLGTRKQKESDWEAKQMSGERKERFVSSLEVSNVFQYNALQTIIQLQSLILYIQTSWFTYTVLLLSWKFNKTKCEIISMVQCFRARRGIREARLIRRAIMNIMAIEDGLLPLTYVTHTSKYLQQCKVSSSVKTLTNNWLLNYISSSLKSHDGERRWQSTIIGVDAD